MLNNTFDGYKIMFGKIKGGYYDKESYMFDNSFFYDSSHCYDNK